MNSAGTLGQSDYGIIICFFVVMLGIGFYFTGRIRDMNEYFAGGRAVPWWLSGISFYMTSFSAFAFVAYSAVAYQYGFVAMTLYWCSVPAIMISAIFFAGRWRRAASTSPLEYIEKRYGVSMRQILVWISIPLRVIDNGLKLFAIGTLVSVGLGFPLKQAIFWSATIMVAYTFMGGLWAVVVTDFVQFVIKSLVMIVLVPLALSRVGGLDGLVASLPPDFLKPLASQKYTLSYMIVWGLIILMNVCTSWALVQRYFSVPTIRDARKVGYMMAVLNVLTAPIMMLPALAAVVFLPGIQDPNSVYATLCQNLLPVGMKGMMIAAMFSATMSALSGEYNALASVLTNDVYRRLIARDATEKQLVLIGRFSTLAVGLACMGVAFIIVSGIGESDLFETMVKVFSIFLPPVAIPMLVGLVSRRVSKAGGLAGLLLGIGVGLAAFALGSRPEYAYLRDSVYLTPLTIFLKLTRARRQLSQMTEAAR
jgi:SSS family solute:Na+ symporter